MTALVTGVLTKTGVQVEGKTKTAVKTIVRASLFTIGAIVGFNVL